MNKSKKRRTKKNVKKTKKTKRNNKYLDKQSVNKKIKNPLLIGGTYENEINQIYNEIAEFEGYLKEYNKIRSPFKQEYFLSHLGFDSIDDIEYEIESLNKELESYKNKQDQEQLQLVMQRKTGLDNVSVHGMTSNLLH